MRSLGAVFTVVLLPLVVASTISAWRESDEGTIEANTVSDRLMRAVRDSDIQSIRQILSRCPELLDAPVGGALPLNKAADWNRTEVVHVLLELGANPSCTDRWGRMPLHGAIVYDNADMAAALIANGADTVAEQVATVNGRRQSSGNRGTAICSAASAGAFRVIRVLLDAGADVAPNVDASAYSALHMACEPHASADDLIGMNNAGNCKVIRALVDGGGRLNERNSLGETPLQCAVARGRIDIARVLLDEYDAIDRSDRFGPNDGTLLHILIDSQYPIGPTDRRDLVTLLVRHGVNVLTQDRHGRTAADLAARSQLCDDEQLLALLTAQKGTTTARNGE